MYKVLLSFDVSKSILCPTAISREIDNAFIPFDPANTDYQQFKKDVAGGVELQDPDGNVMTQAEVDAFLKTIP